MHYEEIKSFNRLNSLLDPELKKLLRNLNISLNSKARELPCGGVFFMISDLEL